MTRRHVHVTIPSLCCLAKEHKDNAVLHFVPLSEKGQTMVMLLLMIEMTCCRQAAPALRFFTTTVSSRSVAMHRDGTEPVLMSSSSVPLALQDALVEANSSEPFPLGDKAYDGGGHLIFHGVRAKVGLIHGEVVKVTPHARTGARFSISCIHTCSSQRVTSARQPVAAVLGAAPCDLPAC
jgi:hypothetical protein